MADITDQAKISEDLSYFPSINNRLLAPFTPVRKSVGVHSKHIVRIPPTRPIGVNDEEINFTVPHLGSAWLDLRNTDIVIKGSIRDDKGEKIPDKEFAMMVRNTYCSLFSEAKVYLGKTDTELTDYCFPYKGLIKSLFQNTNERMSTAVLAGVSFHSKSEDSSDYSDQLGRYSNYSESKEVELISPTNLSLFSTNCYLPPNVPMKIKFRRSPAKFYSLTSDEFVDNSYRFDITDIYMRIPAVRIMPQISPHLDSLRADVNPRIYFDNYLVKNLPVTTDSQVRTFNSVFSGNLPKLMFISFFDEDNFVGKNNLDPFFTSSEKIKDITVIINGSSARKFEVNLEKKIYGDAYKALVESVGASGKAFSISHSSWGAGNTIFAFDFLNCETITDSCSNELIMQGNLDIAVTWSEKTTKTQIMTIIALTTDSVELMKDGVAVLNRVVV
jgi:hypothetical protein